jgi:hypothetical protein
MRDVFLFVAYNIKVFVNNRNHARYNVLCVPKSGTFAVEYGKRLLHVIAAFGFNLEIAVDATNH